MEVVAFDVQGFHLGVADLDALFVSPCIERAIDLQSAFRGRGTDQFDHRHAAFQRPATPVLRDVAEQPMLDLVPLCAAETYEERSNDRTIIWKLFER